MSSILPLLYQDQDLVAINKPPGLPSQPTLDKKRKNALSELKTQLGCEVFLHHRLDSPTSGVLVFSINPQVNKALTDLFRDRLVEKTYLCITKPGQIKTPNWIVTNHLAPVRATNKSLMRMVEVKKGGWKAETSFQLLYEGPNFHVIRAQPHTGRTHQIRVHLAGCKLPILGDFLYGGKSPLATRVLLHAEELKFQHPRTQQLISIKAPYPEDIKDFLKKTPLGL